MPEMHLRQLGFTCSGCESFTKNKGRTKKFNDTFIKANKIKLCFNMIWLMEILNIYLEERLRKKYFVINHLILLKIKNMMDINVELLQ